MLKTFKRISLIAALLVMMVAGGVSAQTDDPKANALILIVANSDTFADWLPNYPDYQVNISGPDENGIWYVEFYDAAWEEWLGYANIDQNTGDIVESFAPKPLPADVYQAQLEEIEPFVMNHPEVLGWLNNEPDLWEVSIEYDRWDQAWVAYFWRGITAVAVSMGMDDTGNIWINGIVDPNELDEETALNDARNSAINLAYSAEGIDAALEGYDEWVSYAEWQYDAVWSVTFAMNDKRLFYALVDLDSEAVLESAAE